MRQARSLRLSHCLISKLFRNSSFFENAVGGMTGFYTGIDRKMPFCDGTEPDFMFALSCANEGASVP